MSNNSTIFGNTAYKNKYGIYCANHIGNRIYLNNLVKNNISAYDGGSNKWYEDTGALGKWQRDSSLVHKAVGNYYSDFDQPVRAATTPTGTGYATRLIKLAEARTSTSIL